MTIWEEFNNIDVRDYKARHSALFEYVKRQMALPGKQYLLIGDTDHENDSAEAFRSGPAIAALMKYAAVPHVCVEAPRELAPPDELAAYAAKVAAMKKGKLTAGMMQKSETGFWTRLEKVWRRWVGAHPHDSDRSQYDELLQLKAELAELVKNEGIGAEKAREVLARIEQSSIDEKRDYIGPGLLGLTHAGLRVTAADSWQWRDMNDPQENGMGIARRMFLGDREVAHYIAGQAHGDRTGIVYGAAHFHYKGGMSDRIGRGKCVHVDVYADRSHYLKKMLCDESYVDYMPDKVYLVKENVLEDPDPRLYRLAHRRTDDLKQVFRDLIMLTHGAHAFPNVKQSAVGEMQHVPRIDPKWFDYVP